MGALGTAPSPECWAGCLQAPRKPRRQGRPLGGKSMSEETSPGRLRPKLPVNGAVNLLFVLVVSFQGRTLDCGVGNGL